MEELKKYAELVKRTRYTQQHYWKTRKSQDLIRAKKMEDKLDKATAEILTGAVQSQLFQNTKT